MLDYFGGEHKSDAYQKINPNAELPALVDGDFVLWESNAILVYAAEKTGNTAVYPSELAGAPLRTPHLHVPGYRSLPVGLK